MTWTSETIRAFRHERGWSQAELAAALEASPSAVANWEAGIPPRPYMAKRLDDLVAALRDEELGGWKAVPGTSTWGYPVLLRVRGYDDFNLLLQIGTDRAGLFVPETELIVPRERFRGMV